MVTFTAPATAASASFPGGGNTAVIDASGQASISLTANSIPGSYTMAASAGGTAGPSFDLTDTPGPLAQLVIHTQPASTATAGNPFGSSIVVYEEDQYGNLETGDNSTVVTASLASGSGTLTGTQMTVSGGSATFSGLTDDTSGTITLKFSAGGLTSLATGQIVVSPGTAAKLVIQTQPSPTAMAGNPFATQIVIDEEDQYGNLETADNSTVLTASLVSGSGTLTGTQMTLSGGIATFSNLTRRHGRGHHAAILGRRPDFTRNRPDRRQPRNGGQVGHTDATFADGDGR